MNKEGIIKRTNKKSTFICSFRLNCVIVNSFVILNLNFCDERRIQNTHGKCWYRLNILLKTVLIASISNFGLVISSRDIEVYNL
jgi:hypothetical protein